MVYWYGMTSDPLEETAPAGALQNDYVFFGGERIARLDATGDIFGYFADHLGSSRKMREIASGATTSTAAYDADFYPFGREHVFTSGSPIYKFTGKIRDTDTGLDDFGARYYSFTIGRFLSADWSSVPVPVPYANLTNPQTLNLYAMVSDNPETFADLDGHCGVITPGAPTATQPCQNSNAPATVGNDKQQAQPTGDGQPKSPAQNAAQLAAQVPQAVKDAIVASVKASNSPTQDDKKGGFHEEGGQWGTDASGNVVVSPSKPGPYAPPGTNPSEKLTPVDKTLNAQFASVGGEWHVHPGGTWTGANGGPMGFVQPPSAVDKAAAIQGLNIVVGAGNKTVYFYDSSKVIAQMSLKNFMRAPQ